MPETTLARPQDTAYELSDADLLPDDQHDRPRPAASDIRPDFEYRPMPVLAPVSLFLGIASFIGLMGLVGLFVAFIGMLVGSVAVWTILRSRGQYGGTALASIGLALSAVFFFTGAGLMYRDYVAELPEGYERVNFPNDISAKQFLVVDGQSQIHPDVKPLEGRKVFLKGWMWNTKIAHGLDRFVLLKDNGKCCMGGDPAPYDMIDVRMQNGMTADYREGLVAVGGVLRMDITGPSRGEAVYVLEADHFARARTSF